MSESPWNQAGTLADDGALPAIRALGLVRDFAGVRAVAGIDLTVARGEIYGFLGPNGAGKSTVIRMLCTLLRPTGGRAEVCGYDVALQPAEVRMRIGVALQEAALDPRQSGRELLTLQGRLYGMRTRQVRRRLDEILDLVDIGDAIDRRVSTYSGGMKRRLDLAAALVHGPDVVFLDEPTTGLDPDSRAKVWHEVTRLNTDLGITIFLTTQYLEEADALAGRVGIIDQGRVIAEGTPEELKHSVGRDFIVAEVRDDHAGAALERAVQQLHRLGAVSTVARDGGRIVVATIDAAEAISPVALVLNGAGLTVRSITLRPTTLDDVFRQLTGGHIQSHATDASSALAAVAETVGSR